MKVSDFVYVKDPYHSYFGFISKINKYIDFGTKKEVKRYTVRSYIRKLDGISINESYWYEKDLKLLYED